MEKHPIGFEPNDIEKLTYLAGKASGQSLPSEDFVDIPTIDVYGNREPWELLDEDLEEENKVHFFSKLKGKKRKIRAGGGAWKLCPQDTRSLSDMGDEEVGLVKTFEYTNPSEPRHDRRWRLDEYTLAGRIKSPINGLRFCTLSKVTDYPGSADRRCQRIFDNAAAQLKCKSRKRNSTMDENKKIGFRPNDVMKITYLVGKASGQSLPSKDFVHIPTIDGNLRPWELFDELPEEIVHIHFFTNLPDCSVGAGAWKICPDKTEEIVDLRSEQVGLRKRYEYTNPSEPLHDRKWILDEYTLAGRIKGCVKSQYNGLSFCTLFKVTDNPMDSEYKRLQRIFDLPQIKSSRKRKRTISPNRV